jgi:chondroitin AC lyase
VPDASVTPAQLAGTLRHLGVRHDELLMAHSSLGSFGHVEGGPDAVINTLVDVVADGFLRIWRRLWRDGERRARGFAPCKLLVTCLVFTVALASAEEGYAVSPSNGLDRDLETISGRLRDELTSEDVDLDAIRVHIQQQQSDGSWAGIDYGDRSLTHWEPSRHIRLLAELAGTYRNPGCALSGDESLLGTILSGLRYWVDRNPQSDNWWWNCIDTPKHLGRVLLLTGDLVPDDLVIRSVPIIRRSTYRRTGANLTWEAGNLMVLACVTRDTRLLRESIQKITDEVRISTDEGIQPDFSFHQHGPQLYMGNYGLVFATDGSRHAALFAGTSFQLASEKIRALSGLILEGQRWFIWRRQFDFHGLGRNIVLPNVGSRSTAFGPICERMMAADPERADAYAGFAAQVSGTSHPGDSGPDGNRHYWRSDTMIHRPGEFYVSLRMHSERTYAAEVHVNRENLKGYHLSDGVYFLMQRGDEYEGLPAVWDWRKLPGLTFRDTEDDFPYGNDVPKAGTTSFVGGVSDGRAGAAAMDYRKEDVAARKAWFLGSEGWVCLGAGISAEREERVTTSINQCRLASDVLLLRNGVASPLTGSETALDDLQAVYHDGVGYYLLGSHQGTVRAVAQNGTWSGIEERSPRTEAVTEEVLSLWIDHGSRPQEAAYAYAILPGIDLDRFAALEDDMPVRVLSNSAGLQAVSWTEGQMVQAAFYEPGILNVGEDVSLHVDAPCLLMIRFNEDDCTLSVSDPTQELNRTHLLFDGDFAGEGCVYRQTEGKTVIAIDLPRGGNAGETIDVKLLRR